MKKKTFVFFLLYFLNFPIGDFKSQEKDVENIQKTDPLRLRENVLRMTQEEEDKKFIDEFFLNPWVFKYKYLEFLDKGFPPRDLLKEFRVSDDPYYRLSLLQVAKASDFNNPIIVQFFIESLGAAIYDMHVNRRVISKFRDHKNFKDHQALTNSWKLRASTAYVLNQKMDLVKQIPEDLKFKLIDAFYQSIIFENEVRAKAIMILTLARIFEGVDEEAAQDGNNPLAQKKKRLNAFLIDELRQMIDKFAYYKESEYYYASVLVRALGFLKVKQSYFLLLNSFDKFNYKLRVDAMRAMKMISGKN